MSGHETPAPTRARVLAAMDKPIPAQIKQAFLAMFLAGAAVFIYGAVRGNGRAWQAFHVNWLFFATISSAAVMFVAAQRITTARWSRSVIRIMEGFAGFLPFAFLGLMLTVFVGHRYVYPWWDLVGTGELKHAKDLWLGHRFFAARAAGVMGLMVLLQLWYVWTSVRLDVGVSPEGGAGWATSAASCTARTACRGSWPSSWPSCSASAGRCWRGTTPCRSTSRSSAPCTAGPSSWAAGWWR